MGNKLMTSPQPLSQQNYDRLCDIYDTALKLEKSKEFTKAAELYRQCLAIDPADHCGASVRLASIGADKTPDKAPNAYISTLFDQHADEFDQILIEDLDYDVPMQLAQLLANKGNGYDLMLDLGCGTGLAGATLDGLCHQKIGVDLSSNMIDIADERNLYDALYINEAVHFLEEWSLARHQKNVSEKNGTLTDDGDYPLFDLIVATDVLPYIGDLKPLFNGLEKNLNAGACLAVSCETLPDEMFRKSHPNNSGWTITPHQRFAHHKNYLKHLLEQYGFASDACFESITVRTEEGNPIYGWLVIAEKNNEK